jgi:hypothetical protein
MFGAHGGVVSVTIVKDQLNRSKGFGFVEVRFSPSLPPSLPPCCASFLSPQGKSILFMSTTHTHTHLSFPPLSLLLFILSHTHPHGQGGRRAGHCCLGRTGDRYTYSPLPPLSSHTHIQMAVKEEGELAIAALDGREIDGRPINVRLGTSKVQPRMRKERTMMKKEGGGELSSLMDDDE